MVDFSSYDLGLEDTNTSGKKRSERILAYRNLIHRVPEAKSILDDWKIFNFLKARNFDVDAAEDMLKRHLEFRKKFQFDELEFDHYSRGEKYMKSGLIQLIGFDKCKHPVTSHNLSKYKYRNI